MLGRASISALAWSSSFVVATASAQVDQARAEIYFKEAAALLEERTLLQSRRFARQPVAAASGAGDSAPQPIRSVEVWDLVTAFQRLLDDHRSADPDTITCAGRRDEPCPRSRAIR